MDHRGLPDWQLRPVVAADRDFLFEMNRQTMFEYVDAVWGWDEEVQRRLFDERFVLDGRRQVVRVGACDVGMIELWDELAAVATRSGKPHPPAPAFTNDT